jgi:hypothetical protein
MNYILKYRLNSLKHLKTNFLTKSYGQVFVPPTSVFGLSTRGVSGLEKTDKTNKKKKIQLIWFGSQILILKIDHRTSY